MSTIKLNLPISVRKQAEQGRMVVAMSRAVLPGPQPLVDALEAANQELAAKQAVALRIQQEALQATMDLKTAAQAHTAAYGDLANHVAIVSKGQATVMLSTGYGVRAAATPGPAVSAPERLQALMGRDPGTILLKWKRGKGVKLFQVQWTTDPSGTVGWITADSMPSAGRLLIGGLESGQRYLLRVRAFGSGPAGPFASPIRCMAP